MQGLRRGIIKAICVYSAVSYILIGIIFVWLLFGLLGSFAWGGTFTIETEELRPMGTGSNFFSGGLVHSSGIIYIGTYGPKPAIIWKYDPKTGILKKVAAPGEYQLRRILEAPNGIIYIGTAYNGLVYRLDPKTEEVTSLGSPPIESTPWIFTMTCTRKGEIYGAKGVGLFQLDWKNDKLIPIGIVPGDHTTLGPNASMPIIRCLEEGRDGKLWGDTNRWLFRFDPETKKIELLVDMATIDKECYCLFLPPEPTPTEDCYFTLYSRFSGKKVKKTFYVYRAAENHLEALDIKGWKGDDNFGVNWLGEGQNAKLVVHTWFEDELKSRVAIVDPFKKELVEYWDTNVSVSATGKIPGDSLYFLNYSPGRLFLADPDNKILKTIAINPMPAEVRSFAISPQRILGCDTYDCAHVFTLDLGTGKNKDHGVVWVDDHRCNYGPAAFAGKDGRYFLANHSQAMQALWVTDTKTNKHWKVGDSVIQLVAISDGTVWGTLGPNPWDWNFDPNSCWIFSWQAKGGQLFRYQPGAEQVEQIKGFENVGSIAEAPGGRGEILAAVGSKLVVFDPKQGKIAVEFELPGEVLAAANNSQRSVAYFVLKGGALWMISRDEAKDVVKISRAADKFGSIERGFFVLPRSGNVVGVGIDGMVTVYDSKTKLITLVQGPVPLPAGPAVDTEEDAWYYVDKKVMKYVLTKPEQDNIGNAAQTRCKVAVHQKED